MDVSQYRTEIMKKVQAFKSNVNRLVEPIAKEEGLTMLQLFILVNVGLCHQQTVGMLAKQLELGQANTSTLCKKMEQEGYLIRERSKKDERIVHLKLSDHGADVLSRIRLKFNQMDTAMEQIPEETLHTILQGFEEAEHIFQYLIQYMEGKD